MFRGQIIAHGVDGVSSSESSGDVAVHVAEALGDLAGAELIEEVSGLQVRDSSCRAVHDRCISLL